MREQDFAKDPLEQFERWFEDARRDLELPEAMTLATAAADGTPSARMVLLKGVDERGFLFFSNYESRKGRELADNPNAALVFHWALEPRRQVLVTGRVERLTAEESDQYFRTRPHGSRLAALASRQSTVVSRDDLDRAVADLEREHPGDDVPRPDWWGGYVLRPETVEFWQNRANRLHDRLRYRRDGGQWILERLSP